MRSALRSAALVAAASALAACSGTGPGAPSGPAAGADPTPPTYPAYETFDASPYDAAPPARVEVVHDVPAGVMQGRVVVPGGAAAPAPSEPRPRQVDGYRDQVFSSASRGSAEQTRDGAVAWWERAQRRPGAPAQLEAVVVYLQPYYRVRLGAFGTEEDAEAALAFVRTEYPEAFLVPDLVTVVD
jgi:hypothetical protein